MGSLASVLDGYTGFVPAAIVAALLSLWAGPRVGRRLGTGRPLGIMLVLAIGLILAATVTPSHDAIAGGAQGSGMCDMSRIGPPSLEELAWPSEALLNILLFVPLGLTVVLLPPTRAQAVLLVMALALPFAIELMQLVVLPLGRECQSGDVVDNEIGLAIGLTAGLMLSWLTRRCSTD